MKCTLTFTALLVLLTTAVTAAHVADGLETRTKEQRNTTMAMLDKAGSKGMCKLQQEEGVTC